MITPPHRLFSPVVLLVGLLVALPACDSAGPSSPPISPDVFDPDDTWTYAVRFTQSPIDSAAVDTLLTATVRMRVAKTDVRIGNASGLVEIETFSLSDPDSIERTWYRQSPDSLVEVAYTPPTEVPGVVPLSRPSPASGLRALGRGVPGLPILLRQRLPPSPKAPTDTTVRSDSRLVLQAPLEQGASWTSFRSPFLSRRSVAGRSTIETRAGQFETVEIATTLPEQAPSLRWSDYIADEGLVQRVVTDTIRQRNDEGLYVGKYLLREVYELEDHQ